MANNTGLKIISVVMAVLLWFYVINTGDANPRNSIVNANLKYINLEEGLTIIMPDSVAVKLWGSADTSAEIIAYVDLKGLAMGSHQLPVKVEPVPGAIFTSVEPDVVTVEIKEEQERSISIEHVIIRNPNVGYELLDILKSPDECIIKGEEGLVKLVNSVICEVDLAGLTGMKTINVPLKPIDAKGNPIDKGLRLVPDNINLYLVINQNMLAKEVKVNPVIIGSPMEGYQLVNDKIIPELVNILVPALIADNVNEVKTKPIDITGRDKAFSQEVELVVPEGIHIYPDKVIINISINSTESEKELEE